jgi:peroxiredoxin family protein
MQQIQPGEVPKVTATDPGFAPDIGAWADSTGNALLDLQQDGGVLTAWLSKQDKERAPDAPSKKTDTKERMLIVFSGDFDRAIAAFILANGAAATGQKVTMFFTFWGLNILQRPETVPVQSLIKSAQENGVRLIACQMTMDIMGIKPEELIDGVEIGGVATYTHASDQAGVNLFI